MQYGFCLAGLGYCLGTPPAFFTRFMSSGTYDFTWSLGKEGLKCFQLNSVYLKIKVMSILTRERGVPRTPFCAAPVPHTGVPAAFILSQTSQLSEQPCLACRLHARPCAGR